MSPACSERFVCEFYAHLDLHTELLPTFLRMHGRVVRFFLQKIVAALPIKNIPAVNPSFRSSPNTDWFTSIMGYVYKSNELWIQHGIP